VAQLLHVFPSFAVGGAQTVTATVINRLGSGMTLIGDAALRARLGLANLERERYGEEQMGEAYAGLVESALRGAA
jgi:hypothetical protein